MLNLIHKRHEGDGWLVFSELGNAPGMKADRWADAVALGVWSSTHYEAHLYEMKISREDLKRELRDPSKAHAVGKFCTYWWLVVADVKVLADLVVPEMWGILIPTVRGGSKILKVHRKAPKQKPAPFSPMFAVAMIRNMAKRWVNPSVHSAVKEQLADVLENRDIRPPADVVELEIKIKKLERELTDLRSGMDEFLIKSGIDLRNINRYEMGAIGAAVKVVADHRTLATGDVSSFVRSLSTVAKTLEDQARGAAEAAVALRGLMTETSCSCPKWERYDGCRCGARPLSEVERKIVGDATEQPSFPQDSDQAPHVPTLEG